MTRRWALTLAALSLAMAGLWPPVPVRAASTFVLVNLDGPGEGLDDPTPFASEGGNPASTLGQARERAVEYAAAVWASQISSPVSIRVGVSFDPLGGTTNAAPLGFGTPTDAFRDFAGAPLAATWYPSPLADRLAGVDLADGALDIRVTFNSEVDGDLVLGASRFYYGFDAAPPDGDFDLVSVAFHELAHGLGFVTYVDPATGAKLFGLDDAFLLHLERHSATPADFPSMTDAERAAAATAGSEVHWTGPAAVASGAALSSGVGADGHLEMYAPSPLEAGSSLGHFAVSLSPDEWMEPFYVEVAGGFDLTRAVLQDLGWGPPSGCAGDGLAGAAELVWVEDAAPPSGTLFGDWTWVSSDPTPFSGTLAHHSAPAAGKHQHYFQDANQDLLPVDPGSRLFAYVYLDPVDPPQEVMLQWRINGSWEHRAYWGANLLTMGTDGTASRRFMGPLPPPGEWVRLEVPASAVGMERQLPNGMAFTLYDGSATWDRAGVLPPAAETVWFDDAPPPSGDLYGNWVWIGGDPTPFSGTLAHHSAPASGKHQHYFQEAAQDLLPIGPGDTLFAYVYLDPTDPPQEVMLQWRSNGSWEHRAYWGANLLTMGTDGTASRRFMGPLPPVGEWVRLEVPASAVDMENRLSGGMAFTLYDGSATWDRPGVVHPSSP